MTQKQQLSPDQAIAANPSENIWVQANAGTGKTSVLVERLLGILFRAPNADASGILCLTYTNAAAGEMRNRILRALRNWAMSSDTELKELLFGISRHKPATDQDVAHARKIFFTYIDNPNMLKIKTIHGFCEEILHQFPIEARISPSWSLITDVPQKILLNDAFDTLINSTADIKTKSAFEHIVNRISEYSMDELLDKLSKQYEHFFQVNDFIKYREYFIDTTKNFLNLDTYKTSEISAPELENIIILTTQERDSSKKPAKYLDKIITLTRLYIDKRIEFEEYKTAYLNQNGEKNANILKKDYLYTEQDRVFKKNQMHTGQQLFADTVALFDLSSAFSKIYLSLKSARNVLDYNDLLLYTRSLFSNPAAMGWVLSQLNVKLSHILVDEAQDTGPIQWDILQMLSGDFFADGKTDKNQNSLFVVGDTKQAIYGFSGTDPRAFAGGRIEITKQIEQNARTIREVPLAQSFRSLPAILRTVDAFFGQPTLTQQTGFVNNPHTQFRKTGDGLVEITAMSAKKGETETDLNKYISNIAEKIKTLIEIEKYSPNDIMVLVQTRNPLAPALTKELKKQNIDVAGADKIVLPNFPAIQDLLNVIRFCLNPDDDYSLSCVLKSPLFRLNEQNIFNLCNAKNHANSTKKTAQEKLKPTRIYDILETSNPAIFATLHDLILQSKTLAPYSFFTQLLNTNNNRENILAAFGTQALDPLEEFITICLAYERTNSGTLKHFLKWFITGSSEIKRDMDAASGVRISTVHGSKGLESKIVILIDTLKMPHGEDIIPLPEDFIEQNTTDDYPAPWLWKNSTTSKFEQLDIAQNALSDTKIAEYYRLLYVAMTRARDKLYIYGYTPNKNAPELSWHNQLWKLLPSVKNAQITNETIRIFND